MIYICAVTGFIIGFSFGQLLLFFLLRGVSREKMLEDKYIQLKYGTINWIVALFGAYAGVAIYQQYV